MVNELPSPNSKQQLLEAAYEIVPFPVFPDPDSLPLPPPEVLQVVHKPRPRPKRTFPNYLSVLTPIDQTPVEQENSEAQEEEQETPEQEPRPSLEPENLEAKTRWVIQPNSFVWVLVKFFSKEVGNFETPLRFEVVGNSKNFQLPVTCQCKFPTINSDPRNVFMRRKKTRPTSVPECFVSKYYLESEKKFDFGPLLVTKTPQLDEESTQHVKSANKEKFRITNNGEYPLEVEFALKSGLGDSKPMFVLRPLKMQLEVDETKDLEVFAFPEEVGVFEDSVLALVKGNPKPSIFPVVCQGEKPTAQSDPELIVFEKILLNQTLSKTFVVQNVSKLPLKWNLLGSLPQEFEVDIKEGLLKPQESKNVTVTFNSVKQQKFSEKLQLEVEDSEGGKHDTKTIAIEAEAFDVKVDVNFGNEKNLVDFGDVKVFDEATQSLTITNQGIYDVNFNFLMKKKATRDMFSCQPSEGVLNPNQSQQIQITFKTEKEVKIDPSKQTSDIKLQITEGNSGEKCNEIPIIVATNAVFSKYSVYPPRNMNFGPLQYGESRNRSFEIKNEGIFDFEFNVFEIIDERQKILERTRKNTPPKEESKTRRDSKKQPEKKPAKAKEVSSIEISQYTISPSSGVVPRASSAVINVTFNAEGARLYQKTLGIDITNRNPSDHPEGIPYDLAGESCIPGINTSDFDMIFEEQMVVPSLDLTRSQQIVSSKVFAQEENVFLYGTQVASKTHEGVVERFKIMNSTKVPANVVFSVKPRTTSKSEGFAFEVVPQKAYIQPHAYEYVKVVFKPQDIMSYGGVFEALVEGGEPNPKTHKLSFELRGEGTLPTVSLVSSQIGDDGKLHLKFPRTRVNKTSSLEIPLTNGGLIPATVKFDMEYHKNFKFQDAMSATLQPKTNTSFVLEFMPGEIDKFVHEAKMSTLSNPYESLTIAIEGEGYREDIMFENLPHDKEDECHFGDCIIGEEKSVSFFMKNYCENPVKFEWMEKPHFFFSPSAGHIAANSYKEITLKYKSEETIECKPFELVAQTVQIEQNQPFEDWDNSMVETKLVSQKQFEKMQKRREEEEKRRKEEAEAVNKKAAKKPTMKKKETKLELEESEDDDGEANIEIQDVAKEPSYQEIDKTQKQVALKAFAVSDYMKYSCEYREIKFSPTLMFASRSFKFAIRNTSKITMPYKFKVCSAETGKLDAGPFSVSPREGSVSPGCDELVTVKFSPNEVDESNARLLVCSVQNLDPELEPLVIELNGKSLRPFCHFELPQSSYREKKAKDMVPIDSSYQILEFQSLGTKVKNTKRFYVVNPTNQGYEFEWEPEEKEGNDFALKQFRCMTPRGVILSGKKFEMVFEYTPEYFGSHETYWKFKIPSEKLTQKFMVVGEVVEPMIVLEKGMVDFNQLLLGGRAKETIQIMNQEHIPFSFSFDTDSVKGEETYGDSLVVSPMTGVVPPQGNLPIEVTFRPKKDTKYNYNLVCNVKRKIKPLVLNVKGVGYVIHHSVHYENSPSSLLSDEVCPIDFGDIFVNEHQERTVQIVNSGKFNFDFAWKKASSLRFVTISPEQGTVRCGESVNIKLKYFPISEHKMQKAKLQLGIVSGPKYNFACKGSARTPGVHFSFYEKDFGPCFVLRTLMPRIAYLEMINYDDSAISVETDFQKLPYLDVQLAPGQVLLPTSKDDPQLDKKKLVVPIVFTPRETTTYEETINFNINDIHSVQVKVKGEGCPVKLELTSREEEIVDFGVVRVGSEKSKTVHLTNKSKRPVRFSLLDGSGVNEMKAHYVMFSPTEEQLIKPKQTMPIEITFSPKQRLHPFEDEILLKFTNGETKRLLGISGACHGIELKLMEEVVGFGAVVQGSHQSKQVQLLNIGDIPCQFQWDSSKYKKFFTISPESGVIQANTELYFDIAFHPPSDGRNTTNNIEIPKVTCSVQGSEPLYITLQGNSIPTPAEQTKDLRFETIVRESQVQKVQVKNPTGQKWRILPSISTTSQKTKNCWTGPHALEISPNATVDYEITYLPLTMTGDLEHQGTLFFPLPDGTAQVYNLFGVSNPPKPCDNIVKEIKAKVPQELTLPVKNWLPKSQRFEVEWTIEGEHDPAVLIRGASTIDVPGSSTKDYKLNYLTYKVCTMKFKVQFTNPTSKEYIFYLVEMKASSQDIQGKVELACAVRESTSKVIMLDNPLETSVQIDSKMITCDNEYVITSPEYLEIPARSESGIEVSYRPLVVAEQQAKLTVKSPVLGDFSYSLVLKGLSGSSQRSMHFSASLGAELVQVFRFQHFLKKQVQYQVKIERIGGNSPPDFTVEKPTLDVQAAQSHEGLEASIPVRFEPSSLVESRAMITLSHPEAGEYTCMLYGHASAPVPQGPYKCLSGKGVGIEFRNPFFESMEFSIKLDNPSFTVSTKSPVKLDQKKSLSIQVVYKPLEGKPNTGRAIVTAGDLPPWIYYLSGE